MALDRVAPQFIKMQSHYRALIVDIDNTLFDWLKMWHASFYAMLALLHQRSGLSMDFLKAEFRRVHAAHGSVEYPFSIEEIPALVAAAGAQPIELYYSDAIAAYRQERRRWLQPYPGVIDTLQGLRRRGFRIAAYTESLAFYARHRVQRLGLDGILHELYSPPDHDLPEWANLDKLRRYPADHYSLKQTVHHTTAKGLRKPNASVLRSILKSLRTEHSQAVYVGDSLTKDILMAARCGVVDVLATYGSVGERIEYRLLREVTHWTREDFAEEQRLRAMAPEPSYVLERGFWELPLVLDKVTHRRKRQFA